MYGKAPLRGSIPFPLIYFSLALLVAEKLGISGFTASNGWLQRFRQHYNLQKMATAGEDGDVSKGNAGKLERARKREYTKWSPENVWKIDKTGSIWRELPKISLNEKGQRCMGGKQAKQGSTRTFFLQLLRGERIRIPSSLENMQNYVVLLS